MVVSPKARTMFLVDVKGLYRMNPRVIKRKVKRDNLFYILAFVPNDQANRFFVLRQGDIDRHVKSELMRLGRPDDYPMTGITFNQATAHESAWDVLPQ
jgi:hypothetical protein